MKLHTEEIVEPPLLAQRNNPLVSAKGGRALHTRPISHRLNHLSRLADVIFDGLRFIQEDSVEIRRVADDAAADDADDSTS